MRLLCGGGCCFCCFYCFFSSEFYTSGISDPLRDMVVVKTKISIEVDQDQWWHLSLLIPLCRLHFFVFVFFLIFWKQCWHHQTDA